MAYVYIPDFLLGVIKLLVIMFFFSMVTSAVVIYCSRQTIIDNWPQYKCNPMVTPFANVFGKDPTKTMQECSSMVFEGHSMTMMNPLVDVFGNITNAMGSIGDIMTDLNMTSSSMAGMFGTGIKDILQKLGNAGSAIQYLVIKMQTLLQRLVATVLVMLYSMDSMMNGILGIMNDKLLISSVDHIMSYA